MKRLILVMTIAAVVVAGCSDDGGVAPPREEPNPSSALFGTWQGSGRAISTYRDSVLFDNSFDGLTIRFFEDRSAIEGLGVDFDSYGFYDPHVMPEWYPRVTAISWAADTATVVFVVDQPFGIKPFRFAGTFVGDRGSGTFYCAGWPYSPTANTTVDLVVNGTWEVVRVK